MSTVHDSLLRGTNHKTNRTHREQVPKLKLLASILSLKQFPAQFTSRDGDFSAPFFSSCYFSVPVAGDQKSILN